jgi:hypothetical protein
VISGGALGAEVKMLAKEAEVESKVLQVVEKESVKAVEKYEVGTFDDLSKRSVKGDGLDIHHAVQKQPAGQIIPGYDPLTAPSIALPNAEHKLIPNLKGSNTAGTARQQLANDIRNLRTYTNAPNSKLVELINLNKSMYPNSLTKLKIPH